MDNKGFDLDMVDEKSRYLNTNWHARQHMQRAKENGGFDSNKMHKRIHEKEVNFMLKQRKLKPVVLNDKLEYLKIYESI
jgi:hypothetical protein